MKAGCLGLVCLIVSTAFAPAAHAALLAFVEPKTIGESDTVELTVRSTREGDSVPEWSGLEQSFDVLAKRAATQIRSINGNVESERTWVLRLRPRRTGALVIPALELDGERSRPLTVTVEPIDPVVRRAIDELVFFETEHSPDPVYVQAQLLVTRRLFYADGAQLYGELPEPPRVDGAVVHPLGEPRATTAQRNGRRYGVLEQGFAIFPERSGALRIPSATVSGSVAVAMAPGAVPRRTGVLVVSKPLEVEVRPIPPEYPAGAPWLPATNVEIVEAWERDPPSLRVGEPITRTLITRADANEASIIPPLDIGTIPAKVYPTPPEQNATMGAGGVIGTRTEAATLVATAPGVLRMPGIAITWWDTRNDRVRTAEVPARTLYVQAAPGSTLPALDAPKETPAVAAGAATQPAAEPLVQTRAGDAVPWVWVVLLALTTAVSAAGWAITWWRSRVDVKPSMQPPDPRSEENAAFADLRRVWHTRDPGGMRRALTTWLRRRAAIAADPMSDARLRSLVGELDAALYGPTPHGPAEVVDALLARVVELRRAAAPAERDEALPPLYLTPRAPS